VSCFCFWYGLSSAVLVEAIIQEIRGSDVDGLSKQPAVSFQNKFCLLQMIKNQIYSLKSCLWTFLIILEPILGLNTPSESRLSNDLMLKVWVNNYK
jgi:hypothetical protein